MPDQRGQVNRATRVNHNGPGDNNDFLPFLDRRLDQRRGLLHSRFHLAFRRYAIAHESESQPVSLIRFRDYANSAHSDYDFVASLDVPKFPAIGPAILQQDQRIHALVLYLNPVLVSPDKGAMVRGG